MLTIVIGVEKNTESLGICEVCRIIWCPRGKVRIHIGMPTGESSSPSYTDVEELRHGDQTELDTPVVHAGKFEYKDVICIKCGANS